MSKYLGYKRESNYSYGNMGKNVSYIGNDLLYSLTYSMGIIQQLGLVSRLALDFRSVKKLELYSKGINS